MSSLIDNLFLVDNTELRSYSMVLILLSLTSCRLREGANSLTVANHLSFFCEMTPLYFTYYFSAFSCVTTFVVVLAVYFPPLFLS